MLLLLIVWPVVEIYVAIRVAEAIGVLWTVLLLIASWPVGTWAIRTVGRNAWRRFGEAVAAGRPPGNEVLNGALVVAGGALLLVPGFITDFIGLCLLLTPTRAVLRRVLVRNLESRLVRRATGATRPPWRPTARTTTGHTTSGRTRTARPTGVQPYDVDSTATDVDQPKLRR